MEPELGLAIVGGRARKVDREAAGGEAEREVEERVEMALGWERDCNYFDLFHFCYRVSLVEHFVRVLAQPPPFI